MTVPVADFHSLEPTAVIELFVLDTTTIPGGTDVYRFHAGTNQLGTAVVWQGVTYNPMPVQIEGFDTSTKGPLPRPRMRVTNLDGVVGTAIRALDDLVGAKVTVKRCFARHLDAVNFTGGVNPYGTPDPTAAWADDPWYVERKMTETKDVIEFELVCPLDVQTSKIPAERISATVCGWHDEDVCIYSVNGLCDHKLSTCKVKWGATSELPFGAFVGTARVR